MPLDTASFIYFFNASIYISAIYLDIIVREHCIIKRRKVKLCMTAKGCQKQIQKRFLISDIQPNGLAGDRALPQSIIGMKFNE